MGRTYHNKTREKKIKSVGHRRDRDEWANVHDKLLYDGEDDDDDSDLQYDSEDEDEEDDI